MQPMNIRLDFIDIHYSCPVCGFDKLTEMPRDFAICPCCGTEFGNDDYDRSHEQLREEWLRAGAHWFNEYEPPSLEWNPALQLWKAGFTDPKITVANTSSYKASSENSDGSSWPFSTRLIAA
jgi:rubredoxin